MLLNNIWYNESDFDKNFHEQASLVDLYQRNILNSQKKIKILNEQKVFLSYWFQYDLDTFILHTTRCSHDKKGFVFTMDMFTPIKLEEESELEYKNRVQFLTQPEIYKKTINHYLNGGQRFNISPRCNKY